MVSQRQRLARKRYREAHPESFPKPEPTPPKDPNHKKKKKNRFKRRKMETKEPKDPNKPKKSAFKKRPHRVPVLRPGESCFICKFQDHIAKNCPQKAQWEKNKICLFCRHRGHSLKNCPNKKDETMDKKLCYNCGETGHSLDKCPQPILDVQIEERPRGQVTKFVSGDDLEDDFMTENSLGGTNKDKSSESIDGPASNLKENNAKLKKKQGPKVVNFVG